MTSFGKTLYSVFEGGLVIDLVLFTLDSNPGTLKSGNSFLFLSIIACVSSLHV